MSDQGTHGDLAAQQRDQWRRAAAGWRKWARLFAQRDDSERYLEAGSIVEGQSVLEVGAGTGDQTLALAERVGPQGRVVATDVSADMLAVAEERVTAAGFDNVEFHVAAAADLDLGTGGFDAAVSGFTLMLVPDPVAAASRVAQLLAPGAPFVASVWGPPPKVPMLGAAMAPILRELDMEPPNPEGPGLFALAQPDRFRGVFDAADLNDVSVTPFAMRMTFPSSETYAEFTRDVAVVISDLVRQRAPERTEEIWAQVAAAVQDRAADDGSVAFDNEALMGLGYNHA